LLSCRRRPTLELVAQLLGVDFVLLEHPTIVVYVDLVGKLVVCLIRFFGTAPAADALDDHGLRYLYHLALLSFWTNPDVIKASRPRGSALAALPLELRSEEEALVFLVAHEAFHYLRKTRQVAGRHGEIEADAFALKMLEQYRARYCTWLRDSSEY
jgi:hypothetical protein